MTMKINFCYTYTYDGFQVDDKYIPPETIKFVVDNIVDKIIWITVDDGRRFPITTDSLVARKSTLVPIVTSPVSEDIPKPITKRKRKVKNEKDNKT